MDDGFSMVTVAVASAMLGAVGFAESALLMAWPLWASATAGAVALIAGVVAFKPVAIERPPPRPPRRRRKKADPPLLEIPAAPAAKPKAKGDSNG